LRFFPRDYRSASEGDIEIASPWSIVDPAVIEFNVVVMNFLQASLAHATSTQPHAFHDQG
jgi:hypothetical protein